MFETTIIQGGMGAGVSDWRLARAVAHTGQLGVVSGTALDTVLARRLQLGDPSGHLRRAIAAFPFQDLAERAFGGSSSRLVMQALSSEQATPEELEEIRQILDDMIGDG